MVNGQWAMVNKILNSSTDLRQLVLPLPFTVPLNHVTGKKKTRLVGGGSLC